MKEWGVVDDESGESMEPMEEVPLIRLGESEMERSIHFSWGPAYSAPQTS